MKTLKYTIGLLFILLNFYIYNNNHTYDNYIHTLKKYEGGNTPYVLHIPTQNGKVIGQSGWTNREGVDFGQQSIKSLKHLNIDNKLIQKLKPIIGVKKQNALRLNVKKMMSEEESLQISIQFIKYHIDKLNKYKNFRLAPSFIKEELIQLRMHTYTLGEEIHHILLDSTQKNLLHNLIIGISNLEKGDDNRRRKTIKNLYTKGNENG